MPEHLFDRRKLRIRPLSERYNKVRIEESAVNPDNPVDPLSPEIEEGLARLVEKIYSARKAGASRILAFGAHTIKNGLAPVLQRLIEEGWITHLATNGAGIIHDWEFAFQGKSSEDVRVNLAGGQFGIWEETGFYINIALAAGALRGLGYGESIGAFVEEEELRLPDPAKLQDIVIDSINSDPETAAAAADMLMEYRRTRFEPGTLKVSHPYKRFGLQAAAFRLGVPFTGHPMFGHDIIYTHPASLGAAIGRTAERDFLSFADSISNLTDGVYLSVGSAVMSPMIFEKSLSMAMNLSLQKGSGIKRHSIFVVDLANASWDWAGGGEPPQDNPAYYLRFLKTFHRMGGTTTYLSADNRFFLTRLLQLLREAA